MTTYPWQLQNPISAIVFDCDGTLSKIEGINQLAEYNGVYAEVEALTHQAMSQTGINPDLYHKRLNLVFPKKEQVHTLGQEYFIHQVTDCSQVISVLQRLQKSIYLLSAGLYPAVTLFGKLLKIPQEHIHAVAVEFDEEGNFLDFDRTSPLITHNGKREIITELKNKHSQIVHIGDGLNDFVVYDLVTRFIGYGGVFYRENIAQQCEFYVRTHSLAPLLPLILTQTEYGKLLPYEKELYHQGYAAIESGKVNVANVNSLQMQSSKY